MAYTDSDFKVSKCGQYKYLIEPTHIDNILPADTIMYGGKMTTVCRKDIQKGGFCGTTIFGCSYKSGTEKVEKVIFWAEYCRQNKK